MIFLCNDRIQLMVIRPIANFLNVSFLMSSTIHWILNSPLLTILILPSKNIHQSNSNSPTGSHELSTFILLKISKILTPNHFIKQKKVEKFLLKNIFKTSFSLVFCVIELLNQSMNDIKDEKNLFLIRSREFFCLCRFLLLSKCVIWFHRNILNCVLFYDVYFRACSFLEGTMKTVLAVRERKRYGWKIVSIKLLSWHGNLWNFIVAADRKNPKIMSSSQSFFIIKLQTIFCGSNDWWHSAEEIYKVEGIFGAFSWWWRNHYEPRFWKRFINLLGNYYAY
jgi:hypothetical protein